MRVTPDPRLQRALEHALPDPSPKSGAKARVRAAIETHAEAGRRFRQTRGYFVAAALAALAVVAMTYVKRESRRPGVAEPTADAASTLVLSSGAKVLVQPGSDVVVERDDERETSIRLARGRIVARVKKREGRPFVVRSRDVQVEVMGTIFAVETHDAGVVSVGVAAGSVKVSRAGETRELAPGEAWRSDSAPAVTAGELAWANDDTEMPATPLVSAAPLSSAAPIPLLPVPIQRIKVTAPVDQPKPRAEAPRDAISPYLSAKELESRGDLQRALETYASMASSSDKNAEDALFATGRLCAKLGDTDGALTAFRTYESRYPEGAYVHAVAVHVLDLLLKQGDDQAVLAAANRFLAAFPDDARAWRFRMARAGVATQKGDCASALRDLEGVPGAEAGALRRRCSQRDE